MNFTKRFAAALALLFTTSISAQVYSDLEVKIAPEAQQYCRVIQFPEAWDMPSTDEKTGLRLFFGLSFGDFEFRVGGLPVTQFLVGGLELLTPTRHYTNNHFIVDLSDSSVPIQRASQQMWSRGVVVPLSRSGVLGSGDVVPNDKQLNFRGFQYNRAGKYWGQPSEAASRLSPDQAWLVLQSSGDASAKGMTDAFFEVYNTQTRQRIAIIEAAFSTVGGNVDMALNKSAWLTARYFIVPLGRQMERLLVCQFGDNASSRAGK